jgi:hypothetical protein
MKRTDPYTAELHEAVLCDALDLVVGVRGESQGPPNTGLDLVKTLVGLEDFTLSSVLEMYEAQCSDLYFGGVRFGLRPLGGNEQPGPDYPWWSCPPKEWWEASLAEVRVYLASQSQ